MVDLADGEVMSYREPNEATPVPVTGLPLSKCTEEHRHLPWLEDYLIWLEGKEVDREYYAWLGQAAPWGDVKMWPRV